MTTRPSHPHECQGDWLERQLCATVAGLRPLYSDREADCPDSWMRHGPDATRTIEALHMLVDALLPGRIIPADIQRDELGLFLARRLNEAWRLLRPEVEKAIPFRWMGAAARTEQVPVPGSKDASLESRRVLESLLKELPRIRTLLLEDIQAAYDGDPAALNFAEVQLSYPGVLAITSHRIAHEVYRLDVPIIPRMMSEWTHTKTGIDIHPGARIGHGFFIDHGTGVVIGETAVIGNHVKLYQGVTLGARSFRLDAQGNPVKHIQRHPTVEDDVVIYAHATILGGDTVIGRGSTIGGNVFLMESVPPFSLVTMERAQLRVTPLPDNGSPAEHS